MRRDHWVWLTLAVVLAVACADDIRVLRRESQVETAPPVPVGGGGDEPMPVGGAPPFIPCQTGQRDPTDVCDCPSHTECFCENPDAPCTVACPDGFCGIQCAYGSVYCDASCSVGCSLFCPEAAYCHLSCDGGCSALCLAGSYCEMLGTPEDPSYLFCEVGAYCVCLGEPESCICEGPGTCETLM